MSAYTSISESPFIVVGIDYGTTYAGAAWAKSGALDQVEIISQWPSQRMGSFDSDKVPSDISYDEYDKPAKWGFGLSESDRPIRWAKLLLSPLSLQTLNTQEETVVEMTRKHMKEIGKSAVDVIADYLRFLWRHILARLKLRLTAPVLDNMVLKVVLTVPAIWDHDAQDKMKIAVRQAGMLSPRACGKTTITLVAEPAAAALATYFDAEIKRNPIIRAGDSFVVCDAGGGTVDLISYKIESFEPFRLAECIGATGDLCGAIYIDRAFLKHVKVFCKHMNHLDRETEKRFMEKEWENNIKRTFDGTKGPWLVDTPQNQNKGKVVAIKSIFKKEVSNILRVDGQHLQRIFAEVVPTIVDLLRDQVQGIQDETGALPRVIILVGGFGANGYLLQEIERVFIPKGITIQQPTRSWSAVCRGAVHHGVQGGVRIVTNHISKFSYGVIFQTEWVEGKFHREDKWWDERRQLWAAVNQITWYLKKNDNVSQVQEVQHDFSALYSDEEELWSKYYDIYYSDRDKPGSRLTSHIHRLCKLRLDLSDFAFTSFPIFENDLGVEFRQVAVVLKMAVTVSSVDWEVWCQGRRARVTVDYEDPATAEKAKKPT